MRRMIGIVLVTVVCTLVSCSEVTQDTPAVSDTSEFESPYFEVSVVGTGPSVILMPGLASSGAVWDETVDALKNDYTLHVVQVSGFAGAPANGNAENENILEDLASGLSEYTAYLEEPPVLVGHSLGGLVTLKTALDPEAQLSSIVVVDVLPFFSMLMDENATAESIAPIAEIMKTTLLNQSDEVFALRQAEALSALVKSEDDLEKALAWSVDSDRAVMAQAMAEVLVTDLRDEISDISVPASILYARDDEIENMEAIEAYYKALYEVIPNHRLIAIDNALHFVMLDQPTAFQAAILMEMSQD